MVSCKAQQGSALTISITAIEWKLTKMGDRDLSAVNPPVTITLDETKKGISGHGGCNRYFGAYQSSGETISFTGIGSTKMFCQDSQAIEDAYFKAIGMVQSFKTEGNKLYLLAQEKVVLEFSK
jgi:heat shock protein HslJ